MSTMRACACGERSTAAWRVSGPTATSSAYRPFPRRNRWSSTRWTFWPISLVVIRPHPGLRGLRCEGVQRLSLEATERSLEQARDQSQRQVARLRGSSLALLAPQPPLPARSWSCPQPGGGVVVVAVLVLELTGLLDRCLRRLSAGASACGQLGGALHRLHDVLVAGAAAQVAGDHVAGLLVRRRRVGPQPGGDRGEEARGAEAALQAVALQERLLNRPQGPVRVGEPLDGGDLAVLRGDGEHQAGPHRPAVDQD